MSSVQTQEIEVMQVAPLCNIVVPALEGSGHVSPDDALELQLFEMEQKSLHPAHSLANKSQRFREEQ